MIFSFNYTLKSFLCLIFSSSPYLLPLRIKCKQNQKVSHHSTLVITSLSHPLLPSVSSYPINTHDDALPLKFLQSRLHSLIQQIFIECHWDIRPCAGHTVYINEQQKKVLHGTSMSRNSYYYICIHLYNMLLVTWSKESLGQRTYFRTADGVAGSVLNGAIRQASVKRWDLNKDWRQWGCEPRQYTKRIPGRRTDKGPGAIVCLVCSRNSTEALNKVIIAGMS